MSFELVKLFENEVASFFGSPYAVAVDSCTHGIELCLRLVKATKINVPVRTYISIPFLANKLNLKLEWRDDVWQDYYVVNEEKKVIIDAAVLWGENRYIPNTMMCLSFQYQKHLSIGRGGMILLDNYDDYVMLKKMSYDGRIPDIPWREQDIETFGYHYYMTPESAQIGLDKLPEAKIKEPRKWVYEDWPDLTNMSIFKEPISIETLLSSEYFINNCDYSFGVLTSNIYPQKNANETNTEFLDFCKNTDKEIITLFIDNLRLYNRKFIRFTNMEIPENFPDDFKYIDKNVLVDAKNNRVNLVGTYHDHNLLNLCSKFPDKQFIIFTGLEDMPIDEEIFDNIPENVIHIFAANSINFGGKVTPIPFGLSLHFDKRAIMDSLDLDIKPKNLLYINHNLGHTPYRYKINDFFSNTEWVTIEFPISHEYSDCLNYLKSIKEHKFMICAEGNAIGCDCYRSWEVLYMKRVPIVIDSEYMRKIFEGFPVLFVNDFTEVTKDFLKKHDYLYKEVLNLNIRKLNAKFIHKKLIDSLNL